MKTNDFSFELPKELIAQQPPEVRGTSRMMVLDPQDSDTIEHRVIDDLPDLVKPGSVVVVNNSRVRRARLFARTETGGRVEFLLVEPLGDHAWSAVASRAGKQRIGRRFFFADRVIGTITAQQGELRVVSFNRRVDDEWLERFGHVPLPPYIVREDQPTDAERYQTVYADEPGSVAAPTAGLHLTEGLIDRLEEKKIQVEAVTLHVGLGTFLPIRTDTVEEHRMHEERYEISRETAERVSAAGRERRPIVAVGTTSMRTLESAWNGDHVRAGRGTTGLYIYPGYRFRVVDALLTNFHTPKSTLLVLVAAFAGWELVQRAYDEAVRKRYRFFSYGDAMLIRSRARSQNRRGQ